LSSLLHSAAVGFVSGVAPHVKYDEPLMVRTAVQRGDRNGQERDDDERDAAARGFARSIV